MIIYKITNTVNDKVYIGKTAGSLKLRINDHFKPSSNACRLLKRAINKYGKTSFSVQIIHECDDEELLNILEIHYISLYDSTNKSKGYNLRSGGQGGTHTEEYKKEASARMMGVDRSHLKEPLFRINVKTMEIVEYPGLIDAINDGFDGRSIRAVCYNERGNYSHKGYYWVYKKDYSNWTPHTYKPQHKARLEKYSKRKAG
jgi:group I intron endonuclease